MNLKMLAAAALIGIGTLFTSCGNTEDTMNRPADRDADRRSTTITPDVEIDEVDRSTAKNNLEDLRDDIDDHIKDVDDHMQKTSNQTRLNDLREYRLELERERAKVTDEIRNIDEADPTTWQSVRQTASNTTKEVGDWFARQGERIEALFTEDEVDEIEGEPEIDE